MPQSSGSILVDENNLPKVKPVGATLLVQPEETPAEKNGIIIPERAKEFYPVCAKVLDLGDSVTDGRFEVGDRVIYSKYSGIELKLTADLRYFIIPEKDVVALILDGNVGLA